MGKRTHTPGICSDLHGKHANTQYNGKCLSRATLVNTQIHGEGAKLLENTQVVLVFGAERLGVGGRRAGGGGAQLALLTFASQSPYQRACFSSLFIG